MGKGVGGGPWVGGVRWGAGGGHGGVGEGAPARPRPPPHPPNPPTQIAKAWKLDQPSLASAMVEVESLEEAVKYLMDMPNEEVRALS